MLTPQLCEMGKARAVAVDSSEVRLREVRSLEARVYTFRDHLDLLKRRESVICDS